MPYLARDITNQAQWNAFVIEANGSPNSSALSEIVNLRTNVEATQSIINKFRGTLNGNGFTITSGIYDGQGLFSKLYSEQ